jgi:hypothetical protein
MAGKYTKQQRTYVAEDIIARNLGVTYGDSEDGCKLPDADNELFLGVVDNGSAPRAGINVPVKTAGYGEIKLSGSCSYGDKLMLASGGRAKKMTDAVAEITEIEITNAATVSEDVIVTLDETPTNVTVEAEDTVQNVADKIVAVIDALEDYSAEADGAIVIIIAEDGESQVDAEFDGGTTGVTATVEVTQQGVNDDSGQYNVIGTAEKDGTDGQIIPFKINPHVYYAP